MTSDELVTVIDKAITKRAETLSKERCPHPLLFAVLDALPVGQLCAAYLRRCPTDEDIEATILGISEVVQRLPPASEGN